MIRILRLSFAFLILAVNAHAADMDDGDSTCNADKECVVVELGGCSGGWIAVNIKHELKFIERANQINSVIECAKMPVATPKPEVRCRNDVCQLVEKQ